jgi:hypothetical protein
MDSEQSGQRATLDADAIAGMEPGFRLGQVYQAAAFARPDLVDDGVGDLRRTSAVENQRADARTIAGRAPLQLDPQEGNNADGGVPGRRKLR